MISEYVAKQRAQALLTVLVGSKLVDTWWNSPNKAFDNQTPAGVWLEDYAKVYNYLMYSANGDW